VVVGILVLQVIPDGWVYGCFPQICYEVAMRVFIIFDAGSQFHCAGHWR
jgi:hypothetical protein